MTVAEFKAWLEGFSAGFKDGIPDGSQWAAISNKIEKIQLSPVLDGANLARSTSPNRPYQLGRPCPDLSTD